MTYPFPIPSFTAPSASIISRPRYLLNRYNAMEMMRHAEDSNSMEDQFVVLNYLLPSLDARTYLAPFIQPFMHGMQGILTLFMTKIDRSVFTDLFESYMTMHDWMAEKERKNSILEHLSIRDIASLATNPYAGVVPQDLYDILVFHVRTDPHTHNLPALGMGVRKPLTIHQAKDPNQDPEHANIIIATGLGMRHMAQQILRLITDEPTG